MSGMFYDCSRLTNLDLSNFNTQNVTDIVLMLPSYKKIANLNLSYLYDQNAVNMIYIFYGCNSLTKENLITKDNKILKAFESKLN